MSTSFVIHAVNLYDAIKLKGIRSLLNGKVIHSSPQELQLQYGDNSYIFAYRFGCLVLFNMPNDTQEREIGKLRAALGEGIPNPTTETYEVRTGDSIQVEFEFVQLKRLSIDYLRLIAMTIGQSAALEYFEVSVDQMLYETSNLMQNLARVGSVPLGTKSLLKMIGSAAGTRQHIISNLSILDPPEETWKSKELGILHKELQDNFEIDLRFRTLDRKLTTIQDNIEILADLTSRRRNILLETLVVILIVVEIIIALL